MRASTTSTGIQIWRRFAKSSWERGSCPTHERRAKPELAWRLLNEATVSPAAGIASLPPSAVKIVAGRALAALDEMVPDIEEVN
jgi:hypothetical protein